MSYLLQRLSVAELPVGGVRELACPRGDGTLKHSHIVGGDLWLVWMSGDWYEATSDMAAAAIVAEPADVGWGGP